MYGAILGDIIGSRFEFDRGGWTKDFELFTSECAFTVNVKQNLTSLGKHFLPCTVIKI